MRELSGFDLKEIQRIMMRDTHKRGGSMSKVLEEIVKIEEEELDEPPF